MPRMQYKVPALETPCVKHMSKRTPTFEVLQIISERYLAAAYEPVCLRSVACVIHLKVSARIGSQRRAPTRYFKAWVGRNVNRRLLLSSRAREGIDGKYIGWVSEHPPTSSDPTA